MHNNASQNDGQRGAALMIVLLLVATLAFVVLSISRMAASAAVVLPEPDSPTMPRVSPARRVRLRSLTAFTWPTVRFRRPA